jgi:hypothetical protein
MSIYIYKNNQQTGPFEEGKVLEWLANGQLSPEDLAVKQGESQWKPLKDLFLGAPQKMPESQTGFSSPNIPSVAGNLPQKSGSKTFLFLLLGFGALFLIVVVGIAGFFLVGRSKRPIVSTNTNSSSINSGNSNSSNSNSNTPDFKVMKDKAKEFAKLTPTVKLENKAILKGKIAIVEHTDTSNEYSIYLRGFRSYDETIDEDELKNYGVTKDQLAKKPEDVDTLVQTLCSKGGKIGTYITSKGSVPAYSNSCKVSVINYRDSKIIAQKTFVNRKLEQSVTLSPTATEYVLLYPYDEIQKYVKSLPKE